jgi:hypothetical protein
MLCFGLSLIHAFFPYKTNVAIRLLRMMEERNLELNVVMYNIIIDSYARTDW